MNLITMRNILENEYSKLDKLMVEVDMARELMGEADFPKDDAENVEHCRNELKIAVGGIELALRDIRSAIEDLKNVRG